MSRHHSIVFTPPQTAAPPSNLASLYQHTGITKPMAYPSAEIAMAAAQHQVWIARGLLRMRRAGLYAGVWIDGGRIRVQEKPVPLAVLPVLRTLRPAQAARLVEAFECTEKLLSERKPAASARRRALAKSKGAHV